MNKAWIKIVICILLVIALLPKYDSNIAEAAISQVAYSLESPHPYANRYANNWIINKPNAAKVRVHFASIDTESGYDFVTTSAGDSWSGQHTDVWSSWITGPNLTVALQTDGSVTKNGFVIDKIEYDESPPNTQTMDYLVRSPHNYWENFDHTFTINKIGSMRFRVHFTKIETEANFDFVTTSAGDSWSGTHTDVWSSWTTQESMSVQLQTDGANNFWGFEIDKIEFEGGLVLENEQTGIVDKIIESNHPYGDNIWEWYEVGVDDSMVKKVRVHFEYIYTEEHFDHLTTSAGDQYSGSYRDVWSSWTEGNKMFLELSSDGSVPDYGFRIDKIEYMTGNTVVQGTVKEDYLLETEHPYLNDTNLWSKVNTPFAKKLRVHFAYIDTESGHDYVSTSAGDQWSGNLSNVWSSWANTPEMLVSFNTDAAVSGQGYKIDQIEYVPIKDYSAENPIAFDTPHPYPTSYNHTNTIVSPGAASIRVHFSKIETEPGFDVIRTSGGETFTGTQTDVWSAWVPGDQMTVSMTADGEINGYGYTIDAIETKGTFDTMTY